ncbi:unnamed protein product [Pipistrellus nathusii]|uniref:Uncharacterized protein n=1 Tax=Pipistrellus nathusii TaxID=59473 RepID=A0ABN9Z4W0_PIPNA
MDVVLPFASCPWTCPPETPCGVLSRPLPRAKANRAFSRVSAVASAERLLWPRPGTCPIALSPHLPPGEGVPAVLCLCRVRAVGEGGGQGSFPPCVAAPRSPAADDELPLTGLDHELPLNCRGAPSGA